MLKLLKTVKRGRIIGSECCLILTSNQLNLTALTNINFKTANFCSLPDSNKDESTIKNTNLNKTKFENITIPAPDRYENIPSLNSDSKDPSKSFIVDYEKININKHPLLINDKGEVLVYYNKFPILLSIALNSRYLIPLGGLFYLIKFNPFYMTFPVMLPIMVFSFCYYSMAYLSFLRSFQNVIEEVWLDKSGSEVRIVYRNKAYRKFRGVQTEEKILNSALISPSGISKKNLFPEKFPFDEADFLGFGTFWKKYFHTRKNYFMIVKRAIYSNFELLSLIFLGKTVKFNLSNAYSLEKDLENLHKELTKLNFYNLDKIKVRLAIQEKEKQRGKINKG